MDRHPDAPRCVVLSGVVEHLAEEFASVTGLTVPAASEVVDTHLIRGTD